MFLLYFLIFIRKLLKSTALVMRIDNVKFSMSVYCIFIIVKWIVLSYCLKPLRQIHWLAKLDYFQGLACLELLFLIILFNGWFGITRSNIEKLSAGKSIKPYNKPICCQKYTHVESIIEGTMLILTASIKREVPQNNLDS